MKILKKIIGSFILAFIICNIVTEGNGKAVSAFLKKRGPVKVAVILFDANDDLISDISKHLEEIQKEHQDKVQYTFYDSKVNEATENENISKALNEGVDLILLNIVNRENAQVVVNKIKATNTPVILFNREPDTAVPMQSYNKSLFIGTYPEQAGTLQGKMLINLWNASKSYIDKDNNNRIDYIMLQGDRDNIEATERTRHSISTIEGVGIETQKIASEFCNWREDLAYDATKRFILKYGNQIEAIIANDDTMAIGAIKALQEHGFNKGDKAKTIPVVGVDVSPTAREFIEKGYMFGSVSQNAKKYAEILYDAGMNLINRRSPIYGTEYQLDETGVAIRIPQTDYLYNNIFS